MEQVFRLQLTLLTRNTLLTRMHHNILRDLKVQKTQIFRFFGPDLCPESAKPFWNLFALQKKYLQIHWRKFQVDKFTEKSKTRFEERNKMARICAQNLFPKGYSLICFIDFIKKIQRSSLYWSKFRISYKNSCLGPKYRLIWPGFVPRTRFE